jgi:hypothetical protein
LRSSIARLDGENGERRRQGGERKPMHSRQAAYEYILRRATRGASVNVRIFLEDEGPWTSRKGEDKKMELAEHFEGKKATTVAR